MPPAARVTDQTEHGGPLGPPGLGSTKVRIEGQPAWRALADVHTCPQSDGPKPHVGGVVVKGSSKVFIDKLPAARQGDEIVEAGRPNKIVQGSLKVSIGG